MLDFTAERNAVRKGDGVEHPGERRGEERKLSRGWQGRVRWLAWSALVATGLGAIGCGGWVPGGPGAAVTPDTVGGAVTVHMNVSESGFDPVNLLLPAGPSIQLILRNRGNAEHHYRVVGLEPAQPLWLAQSEHMVREAGVTVDEHEMHHDKEFVEFRGTSPSGVKPTLKEVHVYAGPRGVDVMHFYALKPGKYEVVDPLHPGLRGTVTVVAR